MTGGFARGRLTEERKSWRKNHPHGFDAKPETGTDGSVNLMLWYPGKTGVFFKRTGRVGTIHFQFTSVKTTLANHQSASSLKWWRPAITVKQILVGIQDLLDQPNPADPAQIEGYQLFLQDAVEYKRRVRQQAKQYHPLI